MSHRDTDYDKSLSPSPPNELIISNSPLILKSSPRNIENNINNNQMVVKKTYINLMCVSI